MSKMDFFNRSVTIIMVGYLFYLGFIYERSSRRMAEVVKEMNSELTDMRESLVETNIAMKEMKLAVSCSDSIKEQAIYCIHEVCDKARNIVNGKSPDLAHLMGKEDAMRIEENDFEIKFGFLRNTVFPRYRVSILFDKMQLRYTAESDDLGLLEDTMNCLVMRIMPWETMKRVYDAVDDDTVDIIDGNLLSKRTAMTVSGIRLEK